MQFSKKGIEMIEQFEGFSSTMYLDSAGFPTIGFGTLIDTVEEQWLKTATITKEQAEELLRKDIAWAEKSVNLMVLKPITQNQFDALVSFAYNLGVTALRNSTLLKKVNVFPNDPTIRSEFMNWVWAGNKKLQGLVNRRTAEASLYCTLM